MANYELMGFIIVGFFAVTGLVLVAMPQFNSLSTAALNTHGMVHLQIETPQASFAAVSSEEKLFSQDTATVLFSSAQGESFHCQMNCSND